MSREASFECALRVFSSCRAGRLSVVDVSEVKKNNILEEVLEMISAAFGCSRLERNPCRKW